MTDEASDRNVAAVPQEADAEGMAPTSAPEMSPHEQTLAPQATPVAQREAAWIPPGRASAAVARAPAYRLRWMRPTDFGTDLAGHLLTAAAAALDRANRTARTPVRSSRALARRARLLPPSPAPDRTSQPAHQRRAEGRSVLE